MITTALETVAHWIGGERVEHASRRGKVVTERRPEQARGADYGFPAHR